MISRQIIIRYKKKKKREKKKKKKKKKKKLLVLLKELREREGTSAMFARRCLEYQLNWSDTCVLTRTRDRPNVICARRDLVDLII